MFDYQFLFLKQSYETRESIVILLKEFSDDIIFRLKYISFQQINNSRVNGPFFNMYELGKRLYHLASVRSLTIRKRIILT